MTKKNGWVIPAVAAIVAIITAAAYLLYKLGQLNASREKWGDYDDYGWS
ncbi:MAG: hypothetical protein FWG83_05580 [Oscillospiraceae bacterium]|nr:hypothetical protein [Oscillospiraceae bacterium]